MDATRRYTAIAAAAVLAVLAAGWFLLVSPERGQVHDLRTAADEQAAQAGTLTTQLATLRSQARALPAQRDRLAAVAAKIPAGEAVPALLRALSDAAAASGARLVSVTPGAPAAAQPPATGAAAPRPGALQVLPVTINAYGDFAQLQGYLAAVEELPRALRVTNLSVAPGADPGAPPAAGDDPTDGHSLVAAVTAEVYLTGGPGDTGGTFTGGTGTGAGMPAPTSAGAVR